MNRLISLLSIVAVILFMTISPLSGAEPTAADYIGYHMPLLGSWQVTVVEGEKTHHGTVQWQLTLGGKSFLVNSHVEGLFDAHTLFGYDPDSGKFVGTSLDGEGRCKFTTLEISDMEPGKMLTVGPIGKWEEKRLPGGGKVLTSRLSCEEMSHNRLVFIWSDRKKGGQSLPDYRLIYEREPMKNARKAFQELADFLVGGVWECDLPDLGKVEQTYRWKVKDRFVVVSQKGGDGERHCVFGLDPASRKPTWWTFKEDGTVSKMVATHMEEGLWKLDIVEYGPSGQRTTMRGTLKRVNDNQAEAQILECHPDPDGLTGLTEVYRRRK